MAPNCDLAKKRNRNAGSGIGRDAKEARHPYAQRSGAEKWRIKQSGAKSSERGKWQTTCAQLAMPTANVRRVPCPTFFDAANIRASSDEILELSGRGVCCAASADRVGQS